jgi:TetR/AcrR family transcriptional regulator
VGAQAILDVAKQLFADKGFDAVSINDIAQRSQVCKANVFHHFGSKKALYLAVLKAACDDTIGGQIAALSGGAETTVDGLWRFFSSHLEAMLRNPDSVRLIMREIVEGAGDRKQALAEQVLADHFTRLVSRVSEGQAEGPLRRDFDPALLAFLMLAANIFFFENRSIAAYMAEDGFARTPADYSREVFDLMLRGALADPAADSAASRRDGEA